MKFTFEHLGNLPKATISLSNFTIVCGSNNMSKTLFNNAIYGLIKYLSSSDAKVKYKNDNANLNFSIDLNDYIGPVKESIKKYQQEFWKELPRVFDVQQELVSSTRIMLDPDSFVPNFNLARRIRLGNSVVADRPAGGSKLTVIITPSGTSENKQIQESIPRLIYYACVDVLLPEVFFMTAERSGISIFQKEIDTKRNRAIFNLKDDSARTGDIGHLFASISNYPISIQDNIDVIRDVSNIRKHKSFLKEKLDAAFQSIVGGTYLTENNDISFSIKSGRGNFVKLPIHYASSSIKSLFLLDLYIKNIAQGHDLLIIDEPELSLHPENQRKLAWLLACLSNYGVKILITTHSDYIVKEISSLLMLGELQKEKREALLDELAYPKDSVLSKENVKCYIMNNNGVVNATIGKNGIDVELFNKEIDDMNRSYDIITRELENEEFH